jgi:hypothetical protein
MKLYSTSFSHENHSPLPQFVTHGTAIYAHPSNTTRGTHVLPWYQIRGNKIYSTISNPNGHSVMPQYEVRGNKVYTTVHNTQGHSHVPVFEIRK